MAPVGPDAAPRHESALSRAVGAQCRHLLAAAPPDLAHELSAVAAGLAAPLRIVVCGRVSAGKSTLVNALAGRTVAATGAAGCTVAVAAHGLPELGLTLLDTPGSDGPDPEASDPAGPDPTDADAVLHVLTDDADVPAIAASLRGSRRPGLGVLTRTDLLEPAEVSPRVTGPRLAHRLAAHLADRVIDVVPVVGLLAETCATGRLAAADVDALGQVATIADATRTAMLAAPDLFLDVDAGPPRAARERLLHTLDLYGISCAVRALRADPEMSVPRLHAALAAASGVGVLRTALLEELVPRAVDTRARRAVGAMEALGRRPDRTIVREALERLYRLPEAHRLRLLELDDALASGALAWAPELADEARRLSRIGGAGARTGMADASAAELGAHALARAAWWRGFSVVETDPARARAAYVVHRAYALLHGELVPAGPE